MSEATDEAAQSHVRPGRTSLKGIHSIPRRYVRRAYSYGAKQAILRELDTHGFDHVITVHWRGASQDQRRRISRLLHSWKASRAKIEGANTVDKRKAYKARPSGVSCILSAETEDSSVAGCGPCEQKVSLSRSR